MSLRSAGRTSSSPSRKYASLLLLLVAACFFAIARLLFHTLHPGGVAVAGTAGGEGGGAGATITDDAITRMAWRAVHPVPYNFSRRIGDRARGGGGRVTEVVVCVIGIANDGRAPRCSYPSGTRPRWGAPNIHKRGKRVCFEGMALKSKPLSPAAGELE